MVQVYTSADIKRSGRVRFQRFTSSRIQNYFGKFQLPGRALIWGVHGQQKSTLTLRIVSAIPDEVLWVATETKETREVIAERIRRRGLTVNNLLFAKTKKMSEIRDAIREHKSSYIALDSVKYILTDAGKKATQEEIIAFADEEEHKEKTWFWIQHADAEGRRYYGKTDLGYDSTVIVGVRNGIATMSKNGFAPVKEVPVLELLKR